MKSLLIALILSPSAFAQATGGAAGKQPFGAMGQFVPLILIGLVFYFVMIRPQQKRLKQEQNMLGTLKKGDEIFTKSGLIGKIDGMTDKVITLEVSQGTKLKVLRGQIGGLASKIFTPTPEKK